MGRPTALPAGPTQLVSPAPRGRLGWCPAVDESWALHAWAAVSLTCLVEKRLGPPGKASPARGGCPGKSLLSALRWAMGNAPSGTGERACTRQPWATPRGRGGTGLTSDNSGLLEQRDPPADRSWEKLVCGQDLSTGVWWRGGRSGRGFQPPTH